MVPMRRLNGWQRIGLVLSALWGLFVTVFFALEYAGGGGIFDTRPHFINTLLVDDPLDPSFLDSFSLFLGRPPKFVMVLVTVVLPIVGGWLLAYMVVWTLKWVMAGFKERKKL